MARVKHAFEDRDVEVGIGDYVGFKSDIEQYGQIVDVTSDYRGERLTLHNPNGFGGDYLRYATKTVEFASDCWAED